MADIRLGKFTDCEFYQEGGRNAYYKIIPRGTMGNVAAGYVVVEGPETTPANAHTDCDGAPHRVEAGMVARIPLETEHYVEVAEGERLEYIYVNRFL